MAAGGDGLSLDTHGTEPGRTAGTDRQAASALENVFVFHTIISFITKLNGTAKPSLIGGQIFWNLNALSRLKGI